MTYKELLSILSSLDPNSEIMGQTITIYDSAEDEYFGVNGYGVSDSEPDILDPNHLFLTIKE